MAFRPFQEVPVSIGGLQEELNRVFERFWHAGVSAGPFDGQKWAPFVDLYDRGEHYALYAEVPGVDASSVEVTQLGGTLTIRGEKTKPASSGDEQRALRAECRFGTFCRTIELPDDVDPDNLSATCRNGVLEITIPKSASSRPKTVRIKVNGE